MPITSVLEPAYRPASDLDALAEINPAIALGIGVIDIKINHVKTPDEVAARIERAVAKAGPGRVRRVHPTAASGCSSVPWRIARSRRSSPGRDRFLGR